MTVAVSAVASLGDLTRSASGDWGFCESGDGPMPKFSNRPGPCSCSGVCTGDGGSCDHVGHSPAESGPDVSMFSISAATVSGSEGP